MLETLATLPTATLFVVIMLIFLTFTASAFVSDRLGHMFIAAFLAAGVGPKGVFGMTFALKATIPNGAWTSTLAVHGRSVSQMAV